MLRGHLDAVSSAGYVEGWAYDTEAPCRPLTVTIVDDGNREIAWGVAHAHREDLVDAGCGTGWCAFRLRLVEWPVSRPWRALVLADRATQVAIFRRELLPYVARPEKFIETIPELIAADPTLITSLQQLSGCEGLFGRFIKTHGIDAFVRAAYLYLLGRPADLSGLRSYGKHLRAKNVTPHGLLLAIANSDEYRARPRQHCAPNVAAFPFQEF